MSFRRMFYMIKKEYDAYIYVCHNIGSITSDMSKNMCTHEQKYSVIIVSARSHLANNSRSNIFHCMFQIYHNTRNITLFDMAKYMSTHQQQKHTVSPF